MAAPPKKTAIVLPKSIIKGIQTVDPTTGKDKGAGVTDSIETYINKSISSLRTETNIFTKMRKLTSFSGEVSMAVASYLRLAEDKLSYKVYDDQHQLSESGALALRSILNTLKHTQDYSYGFDDRATPDEVVSINLREVLLTGACASELVLDEARWPFRLQAVSPSTIKWKASEKQQTGPNNRKIIPYQSASGEEILLDLPTFFFAYLDRDPLSVYPRPPFEPAVNKAVFHEEVFEDIRRVVRRSGHSRLIITINTEKLVESAPPDVRTDPTKLQTWMESVRADLAAQLAAMNPETALILFDNVTAAYLNSEIGAAADYTPLKEMVDSQLSAAVKTPLTVLGKRASSGSQNVSSTESLIFIKHVQGIRSPVQTVMSRVMTLALRLSAFPGYVEATFPPINLRPEDELEAYRVMRQTRILELLSLGFLTDQEAAEYLNTGMRAAGAPALSGTMFHNSSSQSASVQEVANGGDPARTQLSGNTPAKAGGASQ